MTPTATPTAVQTVPTSPAGAAATARVLGRQVARRALLTPGTLQLALGGIWVLALLFLLAGRSGLDLTRAGAQAIGKDSEPSVVAALQIASSLANMHANAANELLLGPREVSESRDIYEAERKTVADNLVGAAHNITFAGEREQIQTLAEGSGTYQGLVADAMANSRLGYPLGLAYFRAADTLMQDTLLPGAVELARINDQQLEQAYAHQQANAGRAHLLVMLTGTLLLLALAATQVFLARRLRRTLNPALVAATLISLVVLARLGGVLGAGAEHLRAAKQDAYNSVNALLTARSVGYDANADESLWLLARGDQRYEDAFRGKIKQLADPPLTGEMVQQARQAYTSKRKPVASFKGAIASELNNITFAGEPEAAFNAATSLATYLQIDGRIRELERTGQHDAAVRLNVGTAEGESNWAYNNYDAALGTLIDINQREFEKDIAQVFGDVSGTDVLLPIALLAVAVLAWLGLQPRIAEYR